LKGARTTPGSRAGSWLLTAAIAGLLAGGASAGGSLRVAYAIDAFLVAPEATIDATAVVVVENRGANPVAELVFVLPEPGPQARSRVNVQGVRDEETLEDLAGTTRISGSRMVVTLRRPLPPGDRVRLRIPFETALRGERRVRDRRFFAADWYPRLDVPAQYRVALIVPETYVVGSTGRREGEPEELGDGGKRLRLRAADVRDFAFVAGRGSARATREVELAPDRTVSVHYLGPAGTGRPRRMLARAEQALRFADRAVTELDAREITVFDRAARGARDVRARRHLVPAPHDDSWRGGLGVERDLVSGMALQLIDPAGAEGPDAALLVGAGAYFADRYFAARGPGPAAATRTEALLSLAGLRLLSRGIGVSLGPRDLELRVGPLAIAPLRFELARIVGRPAGDDPGAFTLLGARFAPETHPWPGLGACPASGSRLRFAGGRGTEEDRAALVLETLARHVGRAALENALGQYARDGRSRAPDRFVAVLRSIEHVDLERLIDQLVLARGEVDFAVTGARSEEIPRGEWTVQERPGDYPDSAGGARARFRARAVVRQLGWARVPADVLFTFTDGSERRLRFSGDHPEETLEIESGVPLASVRVDPERLYALDRDRTNDAWALEADPAPTVELAAFLVFVLQNVLQTLGGMG